MKENTSNRIDWGLIARDMAGELSPEEHKQVNQDLLAQKEVIDELNTLWDDAGYAQAIEAVNTSKAWDLVQAECERVEREDRFKVRFNWKHYAAIAATLLAMVMSYFVIKLITPQNSVNEVMAAHQIEHVSLIDGTLVELNHRSTLRFPQKFGAQDRTVKLRGEAFFSVARDEARPFIIITDNLKIKVLGTEFNVNSDVGNGDEMVFVSSGRVEVTHGKERVVLSKGEVAAYDVQLNQLKKAVAKDANALAWKTGEISFFNTPLVEVMATIEAAYHIELDVEKSIDADSLMLSAEFSHNDLDHVLNAVCHTFNLKYEKSGGKYRISPNR